MVKTISWTISILLALIIAAIVFVYVSPDYDVYLAKGQSMAPAINMGDMVVTGPRDGLLSRDVRPGTIVTFKRGSEAVTHRVLSMDGDKLITKGDAVEDTDSQPTPISDISGVYLFKIPYLGYLSNFMRTVLGWITVVVVPTILLVGLLAQSIVREVKSTT